MRVVLDGLEAIVLFTLFLIVCILVIPFVLLYNLYEIASLRCLGS